MALKRRRNDLDPEADARREGPGEPPDSCPFARPFRKGFSDCPAFDPREFRTLDLRHRPTQPVLTCANLVVGTIRNGAHYGRCTLGGTAFLSAQGVEPPLAG